MYRIVLDHVVLARGLVNPYSICGRLLAEYASRYKAVYSSQTITVATLLPYMMLLSGRYLRIKSIDPQKLGLLFARAEKVSIDNPQYPNIVVATAIAANADYLICEDQHLLAERDRIPVPILNAAAFVALLESELT